MDIFAFSAGFLTPCAVVSRKPSYTYVTLRPFFKWKLKNTPIYKCNPDFKKKSGRCGKHKLSDHLLILFHIHPTEKQQNDDIFNVLPQQLDWLLIFVFYFLICACSEFGEHFKKVWAANDWLSCWIAPETLPYHIPPFSRFKKFDSDSNCIIIIDIHWYKCNQTKKTNNFIKAEYIFYSFSIITFSITFTFLLPSRVFNFVIKWFELTKIQESTCLAAGKHGPLHMIALYFC